MLTSIRSFLGLLPSKSLQHLNRFLNRLSSDLEEHEEDVNDFVSAVSRAKEASSFSSSSSSSSSSESSPCQGSVPFFAPFFGLHEERMRRRCQKDREPCIKIHLRPPVEKNDQTSSSSSSSSSSSTPQTHAVMCDNCETMITGIRFKCLTCPDFDLCVKCEELSPSIHRPDHLFVKIRKPADTSHLNNVRKPSTPSPCCPPPHCPPFGGRERERGCRRQPFRQGQEFGFDPMSFLPRHPFHLHPSTSA